MLHFCDTCFIWLDSFVCLWSVHLFWSGCVVVSIINSATSRSFLVIIMRLNSARPSKYKTNTTSNIDFQLLSFLAHVVFFHRFLSLFSNDHLFGVVPIFIYRKPMCCSSCLPLINNPWRRLGNIVEPLFDRYFGVVHCTSRYLSAGPNRLFSFFRRW